VLGYKKSKIKYSYERSIFLLTYSLLIRNTLIKGLFFIFCWFVMSLSVTRVLDRSLDTFFKNFLLYFSLFFFVLIFKISIFGSIYITYFFNKTVSFFSDAKAVQAVIDLFVPYNRLIEFFCTHSFFLPLSQ